MLLCATVSIARSVFAASLMLSSLAIAPLRAGAAAVPSVGPRSSGGARIVEGALGPKAIVEGDADAEAIARRALATHFPGLGASIALARTAVTLRDDGSRVVAFEQRVGGLVVEGRGARVLVDADGMPSLASLHADERAPSAIVATLDAAAAAASASRGGARIGRFAYVAPSARLALVPMAGALRLAWMVVAPVPAALPVRPVAVVDATTGKVLFRGDLARRAKLVHAFAPNPAVSSLGKVAIASLADGATSLATPKWIAQSCVDNKTVRQVDGLGGTIAMHVCDLAHAATADASGDFLPPRPASDSAADDPLSETSIAYHVDRALGWFSGIGLASLRPQSVPLRVVANVRLPPSWNEGPRSKLACTTCALQPFDNAFYSPAPDSFGSLLWGVDTDALFFGQGQKTDYAYDGDVVYHELGHAVVDTTAKLGFALHLDEDGATPIAGSIHEGLADYFASAITGDGRVGEYAGGDSAIRDLDEVHRCPDRLAGEPHHDSLPLSGALWEARKSLPESARPKLDRAVLLALQILPTNDPSWNVMVSALRSAIVKEAPEAQKPFESAIAARGMGACRAIRELPAGGKAGFDYGYFAYPMSATGADMDGDIAPGVVQLHRALPAGTGRIIVRFEGQNLPPSPRWLPGPVWIPALIVKFGAPIAWRESGGTWGSDASVTRELDDSGSYEETISVPTGAKDVWVMVGTRGEGSGLYDNVEVDAIAGPTETDAGPADATPPPFDAGLDDGGPATDSGFAPDFNEYEILNGRACACRVPTSRGGAHANGEGSASLAFAALAFAASRARRLTRRLEGRCQ